MFAWVEIQPPFPPPETVLLRKLNLPPIGRILLKSSVSPLLCCFPCALAQAPPASGGSSRETSSRSSQREALTSDHDVLQNRYSSTSSCPWPIRGKRSRPPGQTLTATQYKTTRPGHDLEVKREGSRREFSILPSSW